ncbi:MAG: metallophosphoesterase [Clostridia bacterium]|nr:metallophosphoesterase [Clostridia bacterium]
MRETFYHLSVAGITHKRKLAVIADIHDQPYDEVLNSVKQQQPDLVLIPGDFIHGSIPHSDDVLKMALSPSLQMIEALSSIFPVYVSLGNHEWMLCPEDIELIRQTKACVLDNDWVHDGELVLGGLTSGTVCRYRRNRIEGVRYSEPLPYRSVSFLRQFRSSSFEQEPDQIPEYAWLNQFVMEKGCHILLSHHPEYWSLSPVSLQSYPIELTLSGHAHGGQIRYYSPVARQWKGLFAPFQGLFPKYTGGIHRSQCGTMIISRGLSNTARPIPRLFNPTEIVYITLDAG